MFPAFLSLPLLFTFPLFSFTLSLREKSLHFPMQSPTFDSPSLPHPGSTQVSKLRAENGAGEHKTGTRRTRRRTGPVNPGCGGGRRALTCSFAECFSIVMDVSDHRERTRGGHAEFHTHREADRRQREEMWNLEESLRT